MIPESKVGLDHSLTPDQEDSIAFIYRRHAVRAYQPTRVDEWTVRMLLDAAVHAPTAMHREPWRFVVVQDRAMLRTISDRAKAMALAAAAEHGNLLVRPGSAGDGMRSILADPEFNIFYDAETLVVICAQPDEFAGADCWLAAENFMLAAATVGLGTCVIGLAAPALNSMEIRELLRIPTHLTAVAPIVLGVPKAHQMPTPRKFPVVISWRRG